MKHERSRWRKGSRERKGMRWSRPTSLKMDAHLGFLASGNLAFPSLCSSSRASALWWSLPSVCRLPSRMDYPCRLCFRFFSSSSLSKDRETRDENGRSSFHLFYCSFIIIIFFLLCPRRPLSGRKGETHAVEPIRVCCACQIKKITSTTAQR